ncbi:MAG: hypothetical protein A2571_02345 [Candidatus Vogelbacteria bacterium RIFOXYD1_FULL_44_32]|uniref:Uncharacterized protein n=1 Tax=Candidatus Vogelbacteria bacterium RIFOXYD1_FULL_44_32 TaxID=1802438 RepID=A0A1G2QDK3_9BACT|nr:MAG: hypothetical protein A2571_02345 [Candidatus Vogelbacteria bacterium RIFOXYD1_FULL_44_32]
MKKIILFFVILLVAISFVYWFLIKDWLTIDRVPETKPVLLNFSFDSGARQFVAEGQGLSAVEVKAIPTGSGLTEKDHLALGEMTIINEAEKQTWNMAVPKYPISVSEIYAVGFDEQGNKLERIALSILGATDIYDALWKQIPFQEIVLKVGQVQNLESIAVKLLDVPEDNRCPVGVECIQAGRITADLEININGRTSLISLKSDEGERRVGGDYFLNITKVEPEAIEGQTIDSTDYKITFYLTKTLNQ